MSETDQKKTEKDDLVPYSPYREWKFLYFEPGRPGLEESNGFRGLCKYCQLWRRCDRLRPEGGVWRCPDYIAGPMRP